MIFFSCDSNNDGADCNKLLDIYSNASVDFYGGEELPTKEECVAFYNSYVNAYDEGCVNTEFSVSDLSEFTSFQIKIVFKGTNSSYTARIKDLRAIALAV